MEQTLEQPIVEESVTAPVQEDPYAIDESQLAMLAPEARQAFDNVSKQWREKAEGYAKTRAEKAAEETSARYKDYDEHKKYSEALKQLTGDPRFQQWYQAVSAQPQQQQQQMMVARPEEYALAIQEAAAGDPTKFNQLIMRSFQQIAAPTIREFTQLKQEQAQDRELDTLFRAHPDASELDDTSLFGEGNPTPLELAVHRVVDQQGGTFEQAYAVARQIASAYEKKYKDKALGLVDGKKQSVTEQTSQQSKETDNIVEVGSAEEALRKNVEATMRGQKVTYVAKSRTFQRKK